MTGPLGNSKFCFPRISGNKIHCSPRDQSLSVNYKDRTVSSSSSSSSFQLIAKLGRCNIPQSFGSKLYFILVHFSLYVSQS